MRDDRTYQTEPYMPHNPASMSGVKMTNEEVIKQYADYCKKDGKKLYHLPFCIWLKYVYRKESEKNE